MVDPYREPTAPQVKTPKRHGTINNVDCWRIYVNNKMSDTIDVCIPPDDVPVIISPLPISIKKSIMRIPEK